MHPRHGTVMLVGLAVVSVLGLLALRPPTASLAHPVLLPVVVPNPNTAPQGGFPNATVTITARRDSSHANVTDTMLVRWRAVAKDGADLPDAAREPGMARQSMGMGETYDFELTPEHPGPLRIEIRNARGLVGRVPIVVQ